MVIRNGAKFNRNPVYPRSAVFADQRDDSHEAGSANAADKWWTRMLAQQVYNDITDHVSLFSWAITDVSTGSNFFKVANDQTAYFLAGHRFVVRGSTGNDTQDVPYIVTSSSFAAAETTINVASVTNATVDGTIWNGMFQFLSSRIFTISGDMSQLGGDGADVRLANISGFTYTSGYVNAEGGTLTDPLRATHSRAADNVTIQGGYEIQITPAANDVWEIQEWHESATAATLAMGTGHLSASAGHGGVVSHAWIKITTVV